MIYPTSLNALRKDLRALIDYNWADELADYQEYEGDGEHHIFTALVRLDNWLQGTRFTPEHYVKEAGKYHIGDT